MIWASSGREKHCPHDLSENNSPKSLWFLVQTNSDCYQFTLLQVLSITVDFLQHKHDNGFKRTQAQCASYVTMA